MVRANYTVDGSTHTLTVVGHAGYDEYGRDIVCAGVSSLVQALMCWIESNSYCVECISTDDKSGEVIISCNGGEEVSAVFYMTALGIEQIAESYSDYVQINIIGIDD